MEKYLLEKEKYSKILDPDEGFNLRVSGNYKKGKQQMNAIEKNRVNRKLDSKEKIVIKALTEKVASLEVANKNLHKRISIFKALVELLIIGERDNIKEKE